GGLAAGARQRPPGEVAQAPEDLRLALGPVHGRIDLALDLAHLLRAEGAGIEQVEDLGIDRVDALAQPRQPRVDALARIAGNVLAHGAGAPLVSPESSPVPSSPPRAPLPLPSSPPSGSSVSTTRWTPASESPSSSEIRVTPWVARPISRISETRVRTSTPPWVISMISSPSRSEEHTSELQSRE